MCLVSSLLLCYNNDMYCSFYGLKERPFNVTSDPAFFYSSRKHKEALAHLYYGVTQRKGIIVLTGEIGTGKTTLCRFFLSELRRAKDAVKTALILNPQFSNVELLEAIASDFGIQARKKTRLGLVAALNDFLLREAAARNNVILIIDESQNLKAAQLEQVRLLSNLETEKDKLIQVLLVGQPELNRNLALHELRQLQQRVAVRYHIAPLESAEVKGYIIHRLLIAGQERMLFSDEAVESITEFSRGTPRLINMVCDRALLAGFSAGSRLVTGETVQRCLEEFGAYFVP